MAPENTHLPRRRQSAGKLQVTDSSTVHHPTWHNDKNHSNGYEDDNTNAKDLRQQDVRTNENGVNGLARGISTGQNLLNPNTIRHKGELLDDNHNNNNNAKNDENKQKVKEKREVGFHNQVSHISSLSQITLNLTCQEKYVSWRYLIALLLQVAFITSILLRNCMPIALVCMTDPSPEAYSSGRDSGNGSSNGTTRRDHESGIEYEFHWDLNTQSLILSGLQFSSCVGPLLCDFLRVRIGSKHTMVLCSLIAAFLSFVSPIAARISPWVLFTIRVLMGITLGANVSTTADILSWWAPASEKQTMTALAFAGVNIGGIITSLAAGFLCSVPLDNGWPFIFYVFGFLTLLMAIMWHFLNANKPETHPHITESEINFIANYRTPVDSGPKGKPEKPPYKKIFTSIPVLCFLASSWSQVWTTNVYFTVLPNFFVTVHEFTVEEAGVIMSLVSLARFLGLPMWTMIINRLCRHQVSNTAAKKIVLSAGYGLAAFIQVVIMFLGIELRWVVVALTMVVLACQVSGTCIFTVMPMDMAPRYAGFLSGLFYSLGSLISISGPLLVAALAPNATQDEWQNIWIIVVSVYVVAMVIFDVIGDASVQPWARVHRDSRPNIQSAFVTMGRRISAVLDGPITPTPRVRGSRNFSFTNQPDVSMAPSGNDEVLSDQELQEARKMNGRISFISQSQSNPPYNYNSADEDHMTLEEGVVNSGFVDDTNDLDCDNLGMIDKVTSPADTQPDQSGAVLEERCATENLEYIDEPVDSSDKNVVPQITRL